MIWYPSKLIFSEPNITLLNLISHFKNHLLGIGKSNHHSFNIRMLIILCHEVYDNYLINFLLGKSIVTVIHFRKKRIEVFTFFLKKNQQCTLESRIIVTILIVNFSIFFYPGHLYSNPPFIINFQSFLLTFLSVNSHFHHSPS